MTDILKAKTILEDNDISCVIVRDSTADQSQLPGILPLLDWLDKNPDALRDSYIADKLVGKAAALLMAFGNVKEVYAEIISAAAEEFFIKYKIAFSYGKKVNYILNRDKTGMCPMEKRCIAIDSPQEAYGVLKEMVQSRK
jgi:hypothetical protein